MAGGLVLAIEVRECVPYHRFVFRQEHGDSAKQPRQLQRHNTLYASGW